MSRTLFYKLLWMAIVILAVPTGVIACWACPYPMVAGITLAVSLLIPGRIQGHYWRSFFRGRKAQSAGEWQSAIAQFETFLDQLRARPGLQRLITLSWGFYTRSVEAMTENNLGACTLELGAVKAAEDHFKRALVLDPKYPNPHFNLAIVKAIQGDSLASREHSTQAKTLGFNHTGVDRAIGRLGELLAKMEGSGAGSKLEA